MNQLFNSLKRIWSILVQVVCWVAVTIGTFVPEPPLTTLTAAPDIALKRFAQFLGALVLGIFFIFCQKWQRRTHTRMWIAITVIVAFITVGAFFSERFLKAKWTCNFAGSVITIGSQLTEDAQQYSSNLSGEVTCDRLLADYGGDPFQVWRKEEADFHYLVLSVLMIIVWLGAASCIMGVTQAIRCAVKRKH